jgi:predicted transcriptional regulator
MKVRTPAIARGGYKPKAGEPKVWFASIESFARILSDGNRELLGVIAAAQTQSLTELAELSGRAKSNLSRTLRTLERYGLIDLSKRDRGRIAPRVRYTDVVLDVPITASRAKVR